MIGLRRTLHKAWERLLSTPNLDKALDRLAEAAEAMTDEVNRHKSEVNGAKRRNGHHKVRSSSP